MDAERFNYLLRQIDNGDEKALEEIHDFYCRKIKAFSFSYVKNWHYTDDVLNEVIINIWNKSRKYRDIKNPKALIYTLTKNISLDYYKKYLKKYKQHNDFDTLSKKDVFLYLTDNNSYNEFEFFSMISSLPEKEKEILTKKILFDYTFKEISEEIGIPLSTVMYKYDKILKDLESEAIKQKNTG